MERIVNTPKGDFIIRPYRAEDEKGVLFLWNAAFGKEMEPRIWRWKYLENPYGIQIMLCVSEDEIPVAMYAGIPYRSQWKGREIRITHLMDNMSHPAYRGVLGGRFGLFIRTANAFFDHYGGPQRSVFMYGFPGKRHFLLGKRILKYSAFPHGVVFLRASVKDLSVTSRLFSGKTGLIHPDDRSLDSIYGQYRPYFPFAADRDSAFLRWRFWEHPEKTYEIWGHRSFFSKALRGYAVVSIEDNKAYLVDIVAPPSNRVIQTFLGQLGTELAASGIETVETWLPKHHFLAKAAISSGFLPSAEPLGIIPVGRIFDPDLSFPWVSDHIFYTMADGDLF